LQLPGAEEPGKDVTGKMGRRKGRRGEKRERESSNQGKEG